MAFKRSNCKSLVSSKREFFGSAYKFSKCVPFKEGSDYYVILLGLENGFYETPYHRVATHKIDGKTIGFNGSLYPVEIKCTGVDADGNRTSSLCCELAKLEKDRFPDANDAGKRIVGRQSYKVHIPVLILGNSLSDQTKISYPVSKVSILNELSNEKGLKFAFLDMASYTFKTEILGAYGKKLKEEGVLDYELDENSEEFFQEILTRLTNTVVKVHGFVKAGFQGTMKEYSFFPFSNPAIASGSGEAERNAILGYKENEKIMNQVSEFLALFDSEIDNIMNDWNEKDLQEYYNSAIGVSLKEEEVEGSEEAQEPEEEVVVKKKQAAEAADPISVPSGKVLKPTDDSELEEFMNSVGNESETSEEAEQAAEAALNDFEYDLDNDEDFFAE